ncbi:hypothetical protein BV25DRAFT_1912439 [Artomyces pyxidatus]|uniref:Uncharacterized protein n=1 Tax=Artomyces pyxidatus TaxID=48021 RepID=A0ACB8TF94_9AGAM|nr:hypothetical protein BV25DRAFT_1912439 [Artomyces pyxidatus]
MAPTKRASDSSKTGPDAKRTRSSTAANTADKSKDRNTESTVVVSQETTLSVPTITAKPKQAIIPQPPTTAVDGLSASASNTATSVKPIETSEVDRTATLKSDGEPTVTSGPQTETTGSNVQSVEGRAHNFGAAPPAPVAAASADTPGGSASDTATPSVVPPAVGPTPEATTSDASDGQAATPLVPVPPSSDNPENQQAPASATTTTTSPSPEEVAAIVREKALLLKYTPQLTELLPKILCHTDPANYTYVPTAIPKKLVWRDKHLSVARAKAPMKIWIVGTIRTLWFFNGKGKPEKRVTIRVIPLQEEAIASMTSILRKFTVPPTYAENYTLQEIHAAAFSSTRKRGRTESFGVAYPNVFDGRKSFSFNRADLQAIGAEFLHVGDTVIQEITVGQYQTSSNYREQPELKDITRVSFELASIILLSSVDDEESSSSDEDSGDDAEGEGEAMEAA